MQEHPGWLVAPLTPEPAVAAPSGSLVVFAMSELPGADITLEPGRSKLFDPPPPPPDPALNPEDVPRRPFASPFVIVAVAAAFRGAGEGMDVKKDGAEMRVAPPDGASGARALLLLLGRSPLPLRLPLSLPAAFAAVTAAGRASVVFGFGVGGGATDCRRVWWRAVVAKTRQDTGRGGGEGRGWTERRQKVVK